MVLFNTSKNLNQKGKSVCGHKLLEWSRVSCCFSKQMQQAWWVFFRQFEWTPPGQNGRIDSKNPPLTSQSMPCQWGQYGKRYWLEEYDWFKTGVKVRYLRHFWQHWTTSRSALLMSLMTKQTTLFDSYFVKVRPQCHFSQKGRHVRFQGYQGQPIKPGIELQGGPDCHHQSPSSVRIICACSNHSVISAHHAQSGGHRTQVRSQ